MACCTGRHRPQGITHARQQRERAPRRRPSPPGQAWRVRPKEARQGVQGDVRLHDRRAARGLRPKGRVSRGQRPGRGICVLPVVPLDLAAQLACRAEGEVRSGAAGGVRRPGQERSRTQGMVTHSSGTRIQTETQETSPAIPSLGRRREAFVAGVRPHVNHRRARRRLMVRAPGAVRVRLPPAPVSRWTDTGEALTPRRRAAKPSSVLHRAPVAPQPAGDICRESPGGLLRFISSARRVRFPSLLIPGLSPRSKRVARVMMTCGNGGRGCRAGNNGPRSSTGERCPCKAVVASSILAGSSNIAEPNMGSKRL